MKWAFQSVPTEHLPPEASDQDKVSGSSNQVNRDVVIRPLTDVLVDGVDPLDVPRHDVDGGLLRPHLRVEQVVRLKRGEI